MTGEPLVHGFTGQQAALAGLAGDSINVSAGEMPGSCTQEAGGASACSPPAGRQRPGHSTLSSLPACLPLCVQILSSTTFELKGRLSWRPRLGRTALGAVSLAWGSGKERSSLWVGFDKLGRLAGEQAGMVWRPASNSAGAAVP